MSQSTKASARSISIDSNISGVIKPAAEDVAELAITKPLPPDRSRFGHRSELVHSEIAPPFQLAKWQKVMSRSADIVIATVLLIVLSPLLLLIALGIRITSPGPALFKQERVGRDKRIFTCYKFRTMMVGCDDAALRDLIARHLRGEDITVNGSCKLDGDVRVTGLGAHLRRLSLDELPQLFNVVAGNMSLVGPRPMLKWQVDQFPPKFDLRYAVSPGMTGLWQVSGRSTIGTLGMLQLDVDYVSHLSLLNDFRILLRTIPAVLRGDGAR